MKNSNHVFVDEYVLQKDMRIRLPKSIINNLDVVRGETKFAIYLDLHNNSIVLKPLFLNK